MKNYIKRDEYPDIFDEFIDDCYDVSYEEYRRGSNFYTQWIVEINEEYFPDFPELWGFWETNTFIHDREYGFENNDIYEMNRVEKKIKEVVVKKEYWEYVK